MVLETVITAEFWLRSMLVCPLIGMLFAFFHFKKEYMKQYQAYGRVWGNGVDFDDLFKLMFWPWFLYMIIAGAFLTTIELAIIGAGV